MVRPQRMCWLQPETKHVENNWSLGWWCNRTVQTCSMLCPLGVVYMSGCVYAVGGFNGSLRVRTVDCYDPVMDRWTSVSSMQDRRSTLGAAVLNGLLYAVGGFDGSTGTAVFLRTPRYVCATAASGTVPEGCSLNVLQAFPQSKRTTPRQTSGSTCCPWAPGAAA